MAIVKPITITIQLPRPTSMIQRGVFIKDDLEELKVRSVRMGDTEHKYVQKIAMEQGLYFSEFSRWVIVHSAQALDAHQRRQEYNKPNPNHRTIPEGFR